MAKTNRFALLTLDDDCDNGKKSNKQSEKKNNTQAKTANASAKKPQRRKKSSQASKNASNISEEEVEKRLSAIQDLTYEEAIEEAIINSKITYEEEHAKQAEGEFEPAKGKSRKKKPQVVPVGTRGRHGVTMSLADFQAAEYSNGAFVKQLANQEPPPTSQPLRPATNQLPASAGGDDIFESAHREAKRLLQAEKRQEDLKKTMRNRAFEYEIANSSEACEVLEETKDPFGDPSTWREQLLAKDAELNALRVKFEALQQERNELHRYFQITENKTSAQLANEVEKLRKLNGELNNNLVETCIELEKERSRVHELEKIQSNRSGRTQRASENEG